MRLFTVCLTVSFQLGSESDCMVWSVRGRAVSDYKAPVISGTAVHRPLLPKLSDSSRCSYRGVTNYFSATVIK